MQFKHPEFLWALLLLLIPIFIHLFQLRRFKKTPFTNVKFLKKVVSESRRSNTLKKWLLLLTRMLLLVGLVVAFAQPFFAKKSAFKKKETLLYLDDSFSMQAKKEGSSLLSNAVQDLLKSVPKDAFLTVFTNEKVFRETTMSAIQNELLAIEHSSKQLTLEEIELKATSFFSKDATTEKNLIIVSDFQSSIGIPAQDKLDSIRTHLVKLLPEEVENISIDSLYISSDNSANKELTVHLSSSDVTESAPVSLYNGERLIAKTAANFNADKKAGVNFTLPENELIKGTLAVTDNSLIYDNQLYFNIDQKKKIKVLAINETNANFLKRIFTEDEFSLNEHALKSLNYNDLSLQNMVIVNGLQTIPTALTANLHSFTENGGTLVTIPANDSDLITYNALLYNYFATNFVQKVVIENNITDIAFAHPLYQNVFEKKVVNFQYPKVNEYYQINTRAQKLLSFQNKDPFLVGIGNAYIFSASINKENSNFINSPLIVPTLYNMGLNSLQLPKLYSILSNEMTFDVATSLPKDHILKVANNDYEFIPRQQSMTNKVTMNFDASLTKAGIYEIKDGNSVLSHISFNHGRKESMLNYLNLEQVKATSKTASIPNLFKIMEKDDRITPLWKWFIILVLLFLMLEVLIQKFLR